MTSTDDEVFSQRIVIADFYMVKPTYGLDPTYSDFRGHEITKVPVIRIFGTNSDGEKVCMHVHGVFPYFYIPYESADVGDVDQAVYLIASSIDKALNISLGKASSTNQHVFKIQLVKGIPFYGYHKTEHQFLKIYLYNPRFIKRVANLFQNGAIMGKMFQPHESHVPYILQFFIDYDLYGMSFLHVPRVVIKYRKNANGEIPAFIDEGQILPEKVTRMSTSLHELDIAAAFILNRFKGQDKNAQCTNPGIDAIWQDERIRRKECDEEMPSLETEPSAPRDYAEPTESHVFYLTALKRKLSDDFINQTALSTTLVPEEQKQKKTFNLTNLLSNSVYPSECTQEQDKIFNASTIVDHLSNDTTAFYTSLKSNSTQSIRNESSASFVDESVVMDLSQKSHDVTLQDQDLDLLAVMEQLEDDDNAIDPDSTLAPLSQRSNMSVITKDDDIKAVLNATSCGDVETVDSDEDDNDLNFTLTLDDVDETYFESEKTNAKNSEEIIPQLDGANELPRTPSKRSSIRKPGSRNTTPRKLRSKYAPLNVLTISSPDSHKKVCQQISSIKRLQNSPRTPPSKIVRKSDVNEYATKVRKRLEMLSQDPSESKKKRTPVARSLKSSKRKTSKEKSTVKKKKKEIIKKIVHQTDKEDIAKLCVATKPCKVRLKKLSLDEMGKYSNMKVLAGTDENDNERRRIWSPSDIANEYDAKRNFFPQPGPSGVKLTPKRVSPVNVEDDNESILSTPINEELNICSFYEKSFLYDSPSVFSNEESPATYKYLPTPPTLRSRMTSIVSLPPSHCVITPQELPPTYEEVKNNLVKYDIPEMVFTRPFYSNNDDVTAKKEVGHTVLHIPGISLNDLDEFTSLVPSLKGINTCRREMLERIAGESAPTSFKTNNAVREYFSDKRHLIISPIEIPPTRSDANIWIKARKLYLKNNDKSEINQTVVENEDSPIKVRREKVKTMLVENSDGDDDSVVEKSFTLSPLTPIELPKEKRIRRNSSTSPMTPISSLSKVHQSNTKSTGRSGRSATPLSLSIFRNIRRNRESRARLSLTQKLSKVVENEAEIMETSTEFPSKPKLKIVSPIKILQPKKIDKSRLSDVSVETAGTDDTDDTNRSEMVRKILERPSFVKNLNLDDKITGHNDSFRFSDTALDNTYGFKVKFDNLQQAKSDLEFNYLTILVVEVFTPTRKDLKPNPEFDPVNCIFFSVLHNAPKSEKVQTSSTGVIMVSSDENRIKHLSGCINAKIITVQTESELFNQFIKLCSYWDPDILAGYEIEMQSWGYLMDRSKALAIDLPQMLSRIPSQKIYEQNDEEKEQFTDLDIELKLCGRILLDVWRLLRSEIALTSYTFENVVYHILHKRCPRHSFKDLTTWFSENTTQWIVLEYYLERVKGVLDLLDQLDLIGRTSEMAKVIGIQFYEVLSRGSQFRVESMMLRVAKPRNLVPVSPSIRQRAHMRAPEYLPLILEPESRLYTDPVIVLDFQSLYPSMMIAYNYCFSTCLGRTEHLGQSAPFEFGASQLRVPVKELKQLMKKDLVISSPSGIIFVKPSVRDGILPRLVKELLDTRIMIKQSMKLHKNKSALQKILHSRQLALKLIANVTYGYTAANFSGRMACVEVADSIVAKGRETLERAIKLIEANESWRAKVVYGDTDSMFVLVRGRSREEAFRIGSEIAEAVTNDNPKPVKLKLEKVYQPCILQTKKRYVGYMYESPEQAEPEYEAKGIETVRRDGCPIVAKMLEKTLRILFSSCDVSEIKKYVCRQFTKLLMGQTNVQDLIFAKEFRGRNGYKPGACVPALELTKRWLQTDPRNEPRRGERVPFLIVNGPPGVPLIRLVRSPHEYLADDGLKINAMYYITKAIIPPINRCMLLIGADLNEWFNSLPRKYIVLPQMSIASEVVNQTNLSKKSTISQYFSSANCIIDCGRQTQQGICSVCKTDVQKCVHMLSKKLSALERKYHLTLKICASCCGRSHSIDCQSLDCPVLYMLENKERDLKGKVHLENLMKTITDEDLAEQV